MAVMNGILFFFLLLLGLFSFLFLRYMFRKATEPTGHFFLPPSPPSLPVIGHIHHLSSVAAKCFHNLGSKYGPILYIRLGSYPFVLVSSASIATEIFKTHDLNFSSKPKPVLEDRIMFGNSSFSFAPYGDYWRFMKKLCVTELLNARQIERSRNVRREELVQFLRKIFEKAHKNEVVDVGAEVMRLTNNVTCRMAMSTKCFGKDNEAERCRELVKEAFDLALKMTVANFCGPLKKLCIFFFRKKALHVVRNYDELLERLLIEHEDRAKRDDGDARENKDLMDILLEVYHDKDAEIKISRNNIKSFFLDVFIGGTSTSADTILWAMAELINHPNVVKKLRKEIDSVVGDRLVHETDIQSLHYLHAVTKEVLRLYPPGPLMPRESAENCSIGGFDIPKGTSVLVNAYAIMRDPELWDNPNEFRPERFLLSQEEDGSQKDCKVQNSKFIPFGGGRRMCPGSNLAFTMVNTTIAAMVQCFDWKISGGDKEGAKVNMEAKPGPLISMAHPLLCLPEVLFNPFST